MHARGENPDDHTDTKTPSENSLTVPAPDVSVAIISLRVLPDTRLTQTHTHQIVN